VIRLRAGRPGFSSRQRQWTDSFFRHHPQTGSRVHPASYPMSTATLSPG